MKRKIHVIKLLSVLIASLLTLSFGIRTYAELLYLDLFTNTTVTNNSGTTAENPYGLIEDQPVTFEISATGSINVTLIPNGGKKYVVFAIPEAMINQVQAEYFQVDTDVSVPVGGILGNLPNLISSILAIPLLGTVLRNNLTEALEDLLNFENFGHANFSLETQWAASKLLYGEIDATLGPILAAELETRLLALKAVVDSLPSLIVGLLLGNTIAYINNLLAEIANGNLVTELAETAILGNTVATLSTILNMPVISEGAYTADFQGGIVWSQSLPTNDIVAELAFSSIYFNLGEVEWLTTFLPNNLNFGKHPLQMKVDENWLATSDGNQQSTLTTGKIVIHDTTVLANSWQLSVRQTESWENDTKELAGQLSLHFGSLNSGINTEELVSVTGILPMEVAVQQTLLNKSFGVSNGSVELPIDQFSLHVPKDTLKIKGQYTTKLDWVLSQGP